MHHCDILFLMEDRETNINVNNLLLKRHNHIQIQDIIIYRFKEYIVYTRLQKFIESTSIYLLLDSSLLRANNIAQNLLKVCRTRI